MPDEALRLLLLTPGPLSTSAHVRNAMACDLGSRDEDFLRVNDAVLQKLMYLSGSDFAVIPLSGSGTAAVEAMLVSFVPVIGKALVLANGAYGRRAADILARAGRGVEILESSENEPVSPEELAPCLAGDPNISHVVVVHCETTTGLLNPLPEIAAVTKAAGRKLLVDAVSSFGGIPFDASGLGIDAFAFSSGKCLEGVPGLGFVACRRRMVQDAAGNAPGLYLDLHAQWAYLSRHRQWRFTPPTQVVLALHQALTELDVEGGVAGRHARYRSSLEILVSGMREFGFEPYLRDEVQAPIIVTFQTPSPLRGRFDAFYRELKQRGFLIYPGKLTGEETFRVGCIGRVFPSDMARFARAARSALAALECREAGRHTWTAEVAS